MQSSTIMNLKPDVSHLSDASLNDNRLLYNHWRETIQEKYKNSSVPPSEAMTREEGIVYDYAQALDEEYDRRMRAKIPLNRREKILLFISQFLSRSTE